METADHRAHKIQEDFINFLNRWNLDCAADDKGRVMIGWFSQFSRGEQMCEAGAFKFDYCDKHGFTGLVGEND